MKPILFNTEMVRAIMEGRKTVTRRVVKYDFDHLYAAACVHGKWFEGCGHSLETVPASLIEWYVHEVAKQPYQPGDILWVRETWQHIPCIECCQYESGCADRHSVVYESREAVSEGCFVFRANYPDPERVCWRPSIHMPKEAARLFLRVTEVRVERLQDITFGETQDEGIWHPKDHQGREDLDIFGPFAVLWDSTINPADLPRYGWDANPWVWVIEFEKISKKEAGLA